jgi:flagellar export protein FliJ
MKDYAFSLQKLLNVRRSEEDTRRRELASAVAARAVHARRLEGALGDESRARQVKRAVIERAQIVDELLHAQRYLEAVGRQVELARAALAQQDVDVARCREAHQAALRQVRALEKLDGRRRAEWRLAASAEDRRVAEDRPRAEVV